MEIGEVQLVVPLSNVKRAHVSWQRGFLKAVFMLSTSLHLEEEWVSKAQVAFPSDSAVATILQQMLGNRLKVERGSRSAPVKVVGEVVEANSNNQQHPSRLAVSKRKSSTSGVVVTCRKVSIVEPSAVADEEQEELQKERSQSKSSKTSNTSEGIGAHALSRNTTLKIYSNPSW